MLGWVGSFETDAFGAWHRTIHRFGESLGIFDNVFELTPLPVAPTGNGYDI